MGLSVRIKNSTHPELLYPSTKTERTKSKSSFGLEQNIFDCDNIELLNNNSHGLLPPGGLVSPSGGFVSLLCDQGLHFASIKLCQASWM